MNRNRLVKIFANIPVIETERLILRRLENGDCRDMYDYACREDVTRYLLWEPHAGLEYTARYLSQIQLQYRAGEFYDWAVVYDNKMIGTCGFTSFDTDNNRAEIGYVLNPDYWGLGIAPEAAGAVIDYGFRVLSLNRIEARYIIGNERSRRVMEKCGMKYEGTMRSLLYVKGDYRDIGICAYLRDEYFFKNADAGFKICGDSLKRNRSFKLAGWFGPHKKGL